MSVVAAEFGFLNRTGFFVRGRMVGVTLQNAAIVFAVIFYLYIIDGTVARWVRTGIVYGRFGHPYLRRRDNPIAFWLLILAHSIASLAVGFIGYRMIRPA